MKIAEMKKAILLAGAARVTPFIWGHRGLGKSSIVKQAAFENDMGFIDLRCSQMEASDLRGLPDRETSEDGLLGRTIFLPPADMPRGGMTMDTLKAEIAKFKGPNGEPLQEFSPLYLDQVVAGLASQGSHEEANRLNRYWYQSQAKLNEGILFLDEVNRGQDDVLQALFELVLDRRIGQYTLPPGWIVVCAGNYMEGYLVNGFTDPAFLNRFTHLTLSEGDLTMNEWVDYIGETHGADATNVIEFCTQNVKHLDGNVDGDIGFSVQPSRRAWEMVIKVTRAYNENPSRYSKEALQHIIAGLVGSSLANAFTKYKCPVRPHDILNEGVHAISSKLSKLNRGQKIGLTWGVANMVRPNIEDEKYGNTAADYAEWLCCDQEKDLAVAFATSLVSSGSAGYMMITNAHIAKMIGKFREKSNNVKRSFIDILNERPKLQELLSHTSWGSSDDS